MAKFVLFYDTARVPEPPASLDALLAWAEAHPGRFTYPAPPDFIGSTFLKHVLYAAVPDPARLQQPVTGAGVRRADRRRVGRGSTGCDRICGAAARPTRHGPGAAPAPRRRRGRLLDGVQPGRGVEPDPGRPAAGDRAQLRVRGRHHRQHALRRDPIQRRAPGRGDRRGRVPALARGAGAQSRTSRVWGDPTVLALDRLEPADRARFAALRPRARPPCRPIAWARRWPSRTRAGWCCSSGAGPSATAAEQADTSCCGWPRRSPSRCFSGRSRAGSPAPCCRPWPSQPWLHLLAAARASRAASLLTLGSGLGATLLALAGRDPDRGRGRRAARAPARAGLLLPVLLAVPHLASAIGTGLPRWPPPAGWRALLSPWLTGWQRPPDLLTVNDPWGLALTLGLALREAPVPAARDLAAAQSQVATARIARGRAHLRLRPERGLAQAGAAAALPADPAAALRRAGLRALGRRHGAWSWGRRAPPVLAVQVLRWLTDPDPAWHPVGCRRRAAAAGADRGGAGAVAHAASWLVARLARPWLVGGPQPSARARALAVAGRIADCDRLRPRASPAWPRWRSGRWPPSGAFPAALPQAFSLASWRWAVTGLATADRHHARGRPPGVAWWRSRPCSPASSTRRAPASAQRPACWRWSTCRCCCRRSASCSGCRCCSSGSAWTRRLIGLAWSHLVFVLPYTVLMLRGPYLAFDPRWLAAGRSARPIDRRGCSGGCGCRCCAGRSWWRWRWASASAWRSTCRRCSSAPAASRR